MTREDKIDLWERVMGECAENGEIENLFEDGKLCDLLWQKIYAAEQRICTKAGVEECRELNEIFHCWNEICMHVALRMYDYGAEFGK